MYYIYMIRCHDNSIYTGIAKDIYKRMKEHYYKTSLSAKYTRSREVISLEALWITNNRSQAAKLEYYIKHLTKVQKEYIISFPNSLDKNLYTFVADITLEKCLDFSNEK